MSYYITKNIKIEGVVTAVPQNKVSYVDFYNNGKYIGMYQEQWLCVFLFERDYR